MRSCLIIQTAFTGDVILATAVAEKLHTAFPGMPIDFLVRKGNEGLLEHHPYIREVLVWNKREQKTKHLIATARSVRSRKYELVVNLQRFAGSGFISAYSGARYRSGFDKNPLAITYTDRHRHVIGDGRHECERNQQLIARWTDDQPALPRLYPNDSDFAAIRRFTERPFVCIAPGSVWFTKTWPAAQWIKLIQLLLHREPELRVFLLGAPGEHTLAESIRLSSESGQVHNLAGELSFLESAALMSKAGMNYVNDSAPLHLASAMNAPVTAVFCSTVPEFGFGPLSTRQRVIQTSRQLSCRPCGIHGFRACPKGHFQCATTIDPQELL
ncbi:MAG TPA: glycosyltransferase family 9 protein [Bacteroidia bacterium]|jgi:heptosyltransferase-2|nr:glycosyltransferase family 9 protein [Bacteroidia bacterium]HRU60744.1 glycosyltransferase family 9 protein [Bacteroidia bacterium]